MLYACCKWGNSKPMVITQNIIESPMIGKDGDPENPGEDTPIAWKNKYTGAVPNKTMAAAPSDNEP